MRLLPRFGRADLVCRDAVELVTDYLDGALSPAERRRFEKHLILCPHCAEYLRQIQVSITLTGGEGTSTRPAAHTPIAPSPPRVTTTTQGPSASHASATLPGSSPGASQPRSSSLTLTMSEAATNCSTSRAVAGKAWDSEDGFGGVLTWSSLHRSLGTGSSTEPSGSEP